MTAHEHDREIRNWLSHDATPEHRPGFFDEFESTLTKEPVGKRPTLSKRHPSALRRSIIGALATAATIGLVVAVLSKSSSNNGATSPNSNLALPATTPSAPSPSVTTEFRPTLASQVVERATARYAEIKSIAGSFTNADGTVRFWGDNKGNFASISAERDNAKSTLINRYFIDSGNYVTATTETGGKTLTATELSGAVTKRDTNLPSYSYSGAVPFPISRLLNGLDVAENPTLEDAAANGRSAWKIHATTKENIVGLGNLAPIGLNEITAFFDKETLMLLRIEAGGYTSTITDLQIDKPIPSDMSVPDKAAAPTTPALATSYDGGFKRVTMEQLKRIDKNATLLPTSVPDGYVAGPFEYSAELKTVNVTYFRGLSSFSYTLQLTPQEKAHPRPKINSDSSHPEGEIIQTNTGPWFDLNAAGAAHDTVTIEGGAYNGVKGTLIYGFAVTSNLTVPGAQTVVFMGGSLTNSEFMQVIQSVERQ